MVERALLPMTKSVRICERSIFSSIYCFTSLLEDRAILKTYQANLLKDMFELFTDLTKDLYPSICVYLRANPEKCFERMRVRSRTEEIDIVDLEYLRALHEKHETWLNPKHASTDLTGNQKISIGKTKCKVIILDADKDIEEMKNVYQQCLQYLDWELSYAISIRELDFDDNQLQVKLLTEYAYMPQHGSLQAIGFDLFSPRSFNLHSCERERVLLDISVGLPPGTYGRIAARSGLALTGIDIAGGVVDPDFHGNLGVIMCNNGLEDYAGSIFFIIPTPN